MQIFNVIFNIVKQEAINDYFRFMIRQNQIKGSKFSRLVMSVMILLSLLAFLGSNSANADSRKPVNRETITRRNLAAKRSISLQDARQHLASLDFFRGMNHISMIYSLPQHERFLRTEFENYNKKSRPPEIQNVIQLHAPRSADPITASFKG
jgi:hypothetical protein